MSIPKAACTFFRALLHRAEGLRLAPMWSIHHHDHASYGYLYRLTDFEPSVVEEIMTSSKWWRFTIVRDPFSRIVSAYQNKIANADQQFRFFRRCIREWRGFEKYENHDEHLIEATDREGAEHGCHDEEQPEQRIPFPAFVEYICQQRDDERDYHWRLQVSIARPDIFRYDLIGRFESLHMDALAVMRRVKMTDHALLDNRINASEPASDAVWDSRLASMVVQSYYQDFNLFGYDRNGWR